MVATILFLYASLSGCAIWGNQAQQKDQEEVRGLVESFGKKLQMVSLQAPVDVVNKSMQDNYAQFVSPALLAKWESNPQAAPGRMVSSPWPDRIEISSITKSVENTYEVKGEIIEITSVEKESGGAAAKRPITLVVKRVDNRWLIDDVTLGAWEGLSLKESEQGKVIERGPIISFRHPLWTSANPRQDIPIMAFTLAQWNSLQKEEFHIGAAPIGPSELGHNSKYVFALPARYNYAFLPGYEEVENILKGNPLHPLEDNK